jgi:integrator complex subunit 1
MKKGSRLSQRILRQQQEREEARELDGKTKEFLEIVVKGHLLNSVMILSTVENIRRKKLLRAAQKLIMLWDPDCPARKPPREAVELLLSVEELFHLGDRFQQSVKPDFVLLTIGKTTRGAIERAYDWLIPIISNHPSTIARLHSSASCFLLLRAYGTEGNDRRQLKELSAPLLLHVRESLLGKHGESDSVKAFNLLMTDIASTRPDRRRCARRVLQDALSDSDEKSRSWLFSILHLDYATSLVRDAVKHMVRHNLPLPIFSTWSDAYSFFPLFFPSCLLLVLKRGDFSVHL